MIYAFLTILL